MFALHLVHGTHPEMFQTKVINDVKQALDQGGCIGWIASASPIYMLLLNSPAIYKFNTRKAGE